MPPFSSIIGTTTTISEPIVVVVPTAPEDACSMNNSSPTSAGGEDTSSSSSSSTPSTSTTGNTTSSSSSSSATPESAVANNNNIIIPPVIKCSSSRTTSSGRQLERNVSFNAVVQVMEVLNKDQYYKSEKIRTWYSEAELLRIQREGLNVCKRLQHNCLYPEDCTRGLECHSQAGYTKVRKNRMLSKFAVLEEQRKLRAAVAAKSCNNNKIKSSVLIGGKLYRTISSNCLKEATKLAEGDVIEAQNYHLEEACTTTLTERFQRELLDQKQDGNDCDDFKCWFLLDPAKWLSVCLKTPLITE